MKLQTKLIAIVAPLVIVSLLSLGGITYVKLRDSSMVNTTEKTNFILQQIKRNAEAIFKGAMTNIEQFSQAPTLHKYLLSPDDSTRYQIFQPSLLKLFASYQRVYQDYYEIRVLLPDGYEDARITTSLIPNTTEEEGNSEFFTGLKNNENKVYSAIVKNPDNNQYALMVGKSVVISDPNADSEISSPVLKGYIALTMNLAFLNDYAENTSIGEQGRILFINRQGVILFDREQEHVGQQLSHNLVMKLFSPSAEAQFISGTYEYTPTLFQSRSIQAGLSIVCMLPKHEMDKDAEHLGILVFITILIATLITVALLIVVLKRVIVKPVQRLNNASREIGEGDITTPICSSSNDEIGQLAGALEDMRQNILDYQQQAQKASQQAISANRAKSRFLANMSHEIRTPLTSIIGFSELQLNSKQTEKQRIESNRTVINSGKHLLQIINDILDISKVEAGKLKLDIAKMALIRFVMEIEATLKVDATKKQLEFNLDFQFPLPEYIWTDPVRLKQILLNLCNNAIKFTKQGHVKLIVAYSKQLNMVLFTVADTGIGMTKDQQNRVFGAFVQADSSTTRKYGGTGLGLHLSKQLAVTLGGDITLESIEGVGSRFVAEIDAGELTGINLLNAKDHTGVVINHSEQQIQHTLAGKVLLVEDNINNQRLISLYLQQFGFNVIIAKNGQEGVEKALADNFDIILMDIQMPVLNGIDATRNLRAADYDGQIIALTANAFEEDKQLCIAAGCNAVITKPINRNEFYQTLSDNILIRKNSTSHENKLVCNLNLTEEGIAELVDKYVILLPEILNEIRSAFINYDKQNFSRLVHDLISTGGNYGFMILSSYAKKLEYLYNAHQYDEVASMLCEIDDVVNIIQANHKFTIPSSPSQIYI